MNDRADKAINGILIVVAVLTAGSLIMGIIGVGVILDANSNSDEVRRGNEMASCRSEFNAQVVSAQDNVDDARAERDNLVILGLVATATGDEASLDTLVAQTPGAITRIADARERKTRAVEAYAAAVERSRRDPDDFLASCEEGD